MIHIDRKYILLLSNTLRNFKEKRTGTLYNASCPFCGDSQKDPSKARMYAYEHHGRLTIKCFNCGISTSMSALIKQVNESLYRDYCLEKFKDQSKPIMASPAITTIDTVGEPTKKWATPISDLKPTHFAAEYVRNRMIPEQFWDELYYTPDFKELMNADWPDHGKDLVDGEERLVWFLTNLDEYVTHVCGRSFNNESKLRYIKIRVQGNDGDEKIFGLTRANLSQPLYIVEGEIDSFFLPNAVASGDSALERLADNLEHKFDADAVVIFDNEPRNREIVSQMKRVINGGHSIVIWPEAMVGKDLNEMILNGTKPEVLLQIVKDNTYSGPAAELEFMKWKKW